MGWWFEKRYSRWAVLICLLALMALQLWGWWAWLGVIALGVIVELVGEAE